MKNLADKADLADMCPTMGILCMLVLERLVWWVPFCLLHQGEPQPDQQQQLARSEGTGTGIETAVPGLKLCFW